MISPVEVKDEMEKQVTVPRTETTGSMPLSAIEQGTTIVPRTEETRLATSAST